MTQAIDEVEAMADALAHLPPAGYEGYGYIGEPGHNLAGAILRTLAGRSRLTLSRTPDQKAEAMRDGLRTILALVETINPNEPLLSPYRQEIENITRNLLDSKRNADRD